MDDIRKTSGIECGSELRGRIGLQFFAGSEDGSAETGADMDGGFAGETGDDLFDSGLEDQQDAGQETDGSAADGLENQQPEGQEEPPEDEGQGGGPPEGQEPEPVRLTYNGQDILLPGAAVQQLRDALGNDPIALLQKGMNYDAKAERELRLLDQYAAASGLNRAQFLSQLERAQTEREIQTETERARREFPEGTPDAALHEIAKNRVAARQAAQRQQAAQQAAALQQTRERAQQAVQQARVRAQELAWERYEQETGIHEEKDVPARVLELVRGGMQPVEAHLRHQNELLQQQARMQAKEQSNRKASAGSLAGAGDEADSFLTGLFG